MDIATSPAMQASHYFNLKVLITCELKCSQLDTHRFIPSLPTDLPTHLLFYAGDY